ncbi:MAG: 30S ribosomal protein S20 [Bacillota bacterium]|nr:30S ribosomal protein S20 [Bacillota bacterium]
MANTKSALKRARKAEERRRLNVQKRSALKTAVKKIHQKLAEGDAAGAQLLYNEMASHADKIAAQGVIHRNKAARLKARLARRVAKLAHA